MYTLIAYKPNSIDSCRGCVVGRYDSEFRAFPQLKDEPALTEALVEVFKLDAKRAHGEARYEIQIYEDGVLLVDQIGHQDDYTVLHADAYEASLIFDQKTLRVEECRAKAFELHKAEDPISKIVSEGVIGDGQGS